MSGCECGDLTAAVRLERRTLIVLLLINGLMFVIELVTGWLAESTGLLADSLDMLADALVYGLALAAVGGSIVAKGRAARLSGILQILLGLSVLGEVLRRWLLGSEPESLLMMGIGSLALIANLACLALIARHRHGEAHMRASWIFSANDVLANLGVVVSGLLVLWLEHPAPDLLVGSGISLLVISGGIRILRLPADRARPALPADPSHPCEGEPP